MKIKPICDVEGSFFHNGWILEQPRCPLMDKWLNKLVHQYHGRLFRNKNEEITANATTGIHGIMLSIKT